MLRQPVADLYKLNEGCRTATRDLNITLAYGLGVDGVSPVFTVNVPYINGFAPPWGGSNEQGVYHVRFTGDRTVCFTATDNQAVKWGRGLNNTRVQCHVLRFRGPPVFVRSETREFDSPFLSIDQHLMGNGTRTLDVYVGEPIEFTVRARDPNPEDTIAIRVVEDPGLPLGVELGATQVPIINSVARPRAASSVSGFNHHAAVGVVMALEPLGLVSALLVACTSKLLQLTE